MKKQLLPGEVFTQHLIVLGKTGAGKSSVLRLQVEGLLDAQLPVCIIDPKGDWFGLKSSADGKKAGYPVVIFGGDHADVPLNPRAGAAVGEHVATTSAPCIIDLGAWTVADRTRFFIDFASALFRFSRTARHLVIDEIHNFAPQGKVLSPEAGQMLHWANRLASEGRGKGITLMAASQRPQKCHKDFVTSCETLIAMRVIHPLDRNAIKDWIDGCPDREKGTEVLNSLASMPRGTAWVWSPEIGFGPRKIAFPMFSTYDSFKGPSAAGAAPLKGWAAVDLEEVKAKLAAVVEEAKANDPKELKREIADLRRQLATPAAPNGASPAELDRAIKQGVLEGLWHGRKETAERFIEELWQLRTGVERVIDLARAMRDEPPSAEWAGKPPAPRPTNSLNRRASPAPAVSKPAPRQPSSASDGNFQPSSVQQRVLDAVAWYESLGDHNPTQIKIGAVALIDPTGGYFSNVVGPLTSNGLLLRSGGRLSLTEAGRAVAVMPKKAASLDDYHQVLRERVRKMKSASGKTVEVLNAIIAKGGAQLSCEEVGAAVGIDHTGGYFSNTIGPLSTAGLITRRNGLVMPTDVLFPEELR